MNQFDWRNRYPTLRRPTFARNVVSTSQPLAAQAGLRMNGVGSDAFAMAWDGLAVGF